MVRVEQLTFVIHIHDNVIETFELFLNLFGKHCRREFVVRVLHELSGQVLRLGIDLSCRPVEVGRR